MESTLQEMSAQANGVFGLIANLEHEQIVFFNDVQTGLKAIVGIHNTVLGPSLGGTRFWNYNNEIDALKDVIRLSRGMTFKSSISGIDLGGGKAVIIGDASKLKSVKFWHRYGEFIEGLGGRYITAEDVNTSPDDIALIHQRTKHVAGLPGRGGDPSPITAYGVYLGIKAACKHKFGTDTIAGKIILVQGCGHVGRYLINLLIKDNAIVKVSDIKDNNIKLVTDVHRVEVINNDFIFDENIDVYAPCALGATLNSDSINRLKCSIVAGAANNQLEDESVHGQLLSDKNILYAPDFLINAGGVINCYVELEGYDKARALALAEKIYERSIDIFTLADNTNITTHQAALNIAQQRIDIKKAGIISSN